MAILEKKTLTLLEWQCQCRRDVRGRCSKYWTATGAASTASCRWRTLARLSGRGCASCSQAQCLVSSASTSTNHLQIVSKFLVLCTIVAPVIFLCVCGMASCFGASHTRVNIYLLQYANEVTHSVHTHDDGATPREMSTNFVCLTQQAVLAVQFCQSCSTYLRDYQRRACAGQTGAGGVPPQPVAHSGRAQAPDPAAGSGSAPQPRRKCQARCLLTFFTLSVSAGANHVWTHCTAALRCCCILLDAATGMCVHT